jgi:hypothetical protein
MTKQRAGPSPRCRGFPRFRMRKHGSMLARRQLCHQRRACRRMPSGPKNVACKNQSTLSVVRMCRSGCNFATSDLGTRGWREAWKYSQYEATRRYTVKT